MKMNGVDTYEKPGKDSIKEYIDKLSELMEETVSYLHSWCCTRDGEYKPVDYRGVKLALISLLGNNVMASREQSHSVIEAFKNGVINGNVMVSPATYVLAIGLPELRKSELYEKHCENVRLFEEKYCTKHEENK